MSYETELKRYSRSELNELDKMKNKQYNDDEITFEITKEIRTDISNKKSKTLIKKRERVNYIIILKELELKFLFLIFTKLEKQ